MASKLGKEIQIYKANLIVLVLLVCDEPVETGKYICVELGGRDIQVRWRKPRGGAQALSSFHSRGRPGYQCRPAHVCSVNNKDARGKRNPVLLSF